MYDLLVEHDHEYLAGGFVVANCLVWLEEMAAMRQLRHVLDIATPGMRLGPTPHYVATTTPKPRPEVRELVAAQSTRVTRGRTRDAVHLDADVRAALETKYAGTRLGRQELEGELLEDVEGALWTWGMVEANRVHPGMHPELGRVVTAVDPNAGGPDEAGIVTVGIARHPTPDKLGRVVPHVYVLADDSLHAQQPTDWARAAVDAYHRWGSDALVAETNNGGNMVGHTIHVLDPSVRYRSVTATRGKHVRAEPVVALYEQERAHHVGVFPGLEEQQTTWTQDADWSPDRMDALVWAVTELTLGQRGSRFSAA